MNAPVIHRGTNFVAGRTVLFRTGTACLRIIASLSARLVKEEGLSRKRRAQARPPRGVLFGLSERATNAAHARARRMLTG
jgi:hypothetical protein